MPNSTSIKNIFDLAGKFIVHKNGTWDHAGWESFLADAAALGLDMSEANRRSLGQVLEAGRELYLHGGVGESPALAPVQLKAKAKAPAKLKSTAKKKPAAR